MPFNLVTRTRGSSPFVITIPLQSNLKWHIVTSNAAHAVRSWAMARQSERKPVVEGTISTGLTPEHSEPVLLITGSISAAHFTEPDAARKILRELGQFVASRLHPTDAIGAAGGKSQRLLVVHHGEIAEHFGAGD